jgi:hypothetical protein
MQIVTSTVRKLVISEVPRLDPINVFLEDQGPNQGKLTVSCWGDSWTCYWGAMGGDLVQFINRCDAHYILSNLSSNLQDKHFTGSALVTLAKRCIVQRRRQRTGRHDWELGELSKGEAYELWNDIDNLEHIEHFSELWYHGKLLTDIFGEEWHYPVQDKALEENHAYTRLMLIVNTIKAALQTLSAK